MRPFLCLIIPFALAAPALAAHCGPRGPLRDAHVRYVIDGDTIILDSGRHLRIVGLNAPEIAHDGRPREPYSRAARRQLIKLLAKADDNIGWRAAPERRDHYGRTLAHVYVEGKNVARALLKSGLAAVIAIPPNVALADCLVAAETVARRHHRGLWSPRSGAVHDEAQSGFEIVRGRITAVSAKHAGTLLTLDDGLTLWIPADDRHYFDRPLEALAGDKVLVRGWLHDYHGRPEITVHHPAVLTVIPASAP